jgi:hypothetical protein
MMKAIARRGLRLKELFARVFGFEIRVVGPSLFPSNLFLESRTTGYVLLAEMRTPGLEGCELGGDRGKPVANLQSPAGRKYLGIDERDDLESRKNRNFPSAVPQRHPNKTPEDWATEEASGELGMRKREDECLASHQTKTQRDAAIALLGTIPATAPLSIGASLLDPSRQTI